jgi:hypothetical protein
VVVERESSSWKWDACTIGGWAWCRARGVGSLRSRGGMNCRSVTLAREWGRRDWVRGLHSGGVFGGHLDGAWHGMALHCRAFGFAYNISIIYLPLHASPVFRFPLFTHDVLATYSPCRYSRLHLRHPPLVHHHRHSSSFAITTPSYANTHPQYPCLPLSAPILFAANTDKQ